MISVLSGLNHIIPAAQNKMDFAFGLRDNSILLVMRSVSNRNHLHLRKVLSENVKVKLYREEKERKSSERNQDQ